MWLDAERCTAILGQVINSCRSLRFGFWGPWQAASGTYLGRHLKRVLNAAGQRARRM